MTDRLIVLPAASTPDPDALSLIAPREAEVLWEELVQAVRALAAALENAVLAQRRPMTEADPPEASLSHGLADHHVRRP